MICPSCNTEIPDGMNFCENCGAPLRADSAQQVVEPQGQQTYQQSYSSPQGGPAYSSPYDAQPAGQPYDSQQYGQQNAGDPYGAQQPGAAPTYPGVYAAPGATGAQVSNTPFVLAIIALVTAFLGLFPVSLVLGIVALSMNSAQKKRGEFSTKQKPTTVMAIISLVVTGLVLVTSIVFGGILAAYMASGDFDSSSSRPVASASTSASSAKSSSSKGSASSSAAAGASASASSASSAGAAGASGSASAAAPAGDVAQNLAGSWKLTRLVSNGEVADADDIELMQNVGLTVSLDLNADGTARFVLFGVNMAGTWSSPDGTNVTLNFDGMPMNATVAGDALSLTHDQDEMTFTKQ